MCYPNGSVNWTVTPLEVCSLLRTECHGQPALKRGTQDHYLSIGVHGGELGTAGR